MTALPASGCVATHLADREEEGCVVLSTAVVSDIGILSPLLTGNAPDIHMAWDKHCVCPVHVEAQEGSRRQQRDVVVACEAGCCKVWGGPAHKTTLLQSLVGPAQRMTLYDITLLSL